MPRRRNSPPPVAVDSSMEFDVALAQAHSNPGSYAARYQVSEDGAVIPRTSNPNEQTPNVRIETGADGVMNAYIPQLAVGTSGGSNYPLMNLAAPPESNVWGDSEYFGMWDTVLDQRDGKWNIRRAIRWWQRDPLVYRCIRLLCQLSNSRITFKSEDQDAKNLIENWFNQAMPYSFRSAFFLEYFRTGYVPTIKTLVKYEPRNYKDGKIPKTGNGSNIDDHTYIPARAGFESDVVDIVDNDPELAEERRVQQLAEIEEVARATASLAKTQELIRVAEETEKEYRLALANYELAKTNFDRGLCSAQRLDWYQNNLNVQQYKWQKGQIPGGYTILDPLLVDLKGPQSMAWLREPYLQVSGDLIAAIMAPTALQKMMIDKLPREIVQQIRDGATYVWLSPNICTISTHDRQPYERYPTPMMRHCFEALEMKYDIYAMDKATVRGIKNRVLLVKVGNDTYPVTDAMTIQTVASIFNSVGRTGTFFWSHAIEMEWIEPDLASFNDPEKYSHCNNEIRTTFGVANFITGADTTGSIGNNMISFKGVQQEVNAAQMSFIEMLEKEIRLLKAALSLSADIQIDFDQLNLKDENQFWTVITQAVMNGIIDHQTALEVLGFHFPQITERMKTMQPLKKQGLFAPQPSANNMGPDGKMKPAGAGGGGIGGRQKNTNPPGKNKNKAGKSQPKKAKAQMRAVGDEVYVLVEAADLDSEQRKDIAKLYSVPEKYVQTTAEFTMAFPNVDMTPDWPELTAIEAMAATIDASRYVVGAEARFEKACADFKEKSEGAGARGPYLTAQKKEELRSTAMALSIAAGSPEGGLPTGWNKHYDATRKTLASTFTGLAPHHLDAHAHAITAARYAKVKGQ